jgi:hypothetical protein
MKPDVWGTISPQMSLRLLPDASSDDSPASGIVLHGKVRRDGKLLDFNTTLERPAKATKTGDLQPDETVVELDFEPQPQSETAK